MDKIDFVKLYNKYNEKYLPSVKIYKINHLSPEEKNSLAKYFLSSPFISKTIAQKVVDIIAKSHIKDYIIPITLPQGEVNFHFITNKNSSFIENLIKYYFYVVFIRLEYNNKYNKLQFLPNIYINIIPTNSPKKLRKNIQIDDINSASTVIYPDYYGGAIYIWRLDEIEKVLIHETLHSFHYDWDIIKQKLIPQLSDFQQECCAKLNINEAYTELCAVFIYNLFKGNSRKQLRENLLKDLQHSLENCGQLLEINDVKLGNNLYLENYNQNASAFSYIILKTGLLWLMINKCKDKKSKHTDRLKCLEEFLGIGFWGNMGESYQDILLSLINNEDYVKEIKLHMDKKRGRPSKLILAL